MTGTLFTKRATSGRNTIAKILPGSQLVFSDIFITKLLVPSFKHKLLSGQSCLPAGLTFIEYFSKSLGLSKALYVSPYAVILAACLWATEVPDLNSCFVVSLGWAHSSLLWVNYHMGLCELRRGDLTHIDEPNKNRMKCCGTPRITKLFRQRCYRSRDQPVYINEGPETVRCQYSFTKNIEGMQTKKAARARQVR